MSYLIAGNWKMNGTPSSAQDLAMGLANRAKGGAKSEIALCPPSPLLSIAATAIAGSPIALGAQDCHASEKGAHTGDTSAWLLKAIGCRYVIVGHSERRADHGETDAVVKAKAAAALKAGLTPIVCVGETDAQRETGETAAVIARQVAGSVPDGATPANTVIAYEPVWAIGTGKTATTADIAAVHAQVRDVFKATAGSADGLRILYGGSVKGSNAAEILATKGVNGALVGGASLDLEDFWKIISSCPQG
jgi:triosephosphate isomerase